MTSLCYNTFTHRKAAMNSISIGQKVKSLRENAGINQAQIAQFLGIDQSTISKCEKGERQFQIDHLEQLASLFGVTLTDLMSEHNAPAPLQIAFRAAGLRTEDLHAIADIQKIALNLEWMASLITENPIEA